MALNFAVQEGRKDIIGVLKDAQRKVRVHIHVDPELVA